MDTIIWPRSAFRALDVVKKFRLVVLKMTITPWASLDTVQGIGCPGGGTANPDQFDDNSHIEPYPSTPTDSSSVPMPKVKSVTV